MKFLVYDQVLLYVGWEYGKNFCMYCGIGWCVQGVFEQGGF